MKLKKKDKEMLKHAGHGFFSYSANNLYFFFVSFSAFFLTPVGSY